MQRTHNQEVMYSNLETGWNLGAEIVITLSNKKDSQQGHTQNYLNKNCFAYIDE